MYWEQNTLLCVTDCYDAIDMRNMWNMWMKERQLLKFLNSDTATSPPWMILTNFDILGSPPWTSPPPTFLKSLFPPLGDWGPQNRSPPLTEGGGQKPCKPMCARCEGRGFIQWSIFWPKILISSPALKIQKTYFFPVFTAILAVALSHECKIILKMEGVSTENFKILDLKLLKIDRKWQKKAKIP